MRSTSTAAKKGYAAEDLGSSHRNHESMAADVLMILTERESGRMSQQSRRRLRSAAQPRVRAARPPRRRRYCTEIGRSGYRAEPEPSVMETPNGDGENQTVQTRTTVRARLVEQVDTADVGNEARAFQALAGRRRS